MQGVGTTTNRELLGVWLWRGWRKRRRVGPAWHTVARIGLLGGALLLAACGGESSDADDAASSANGGNGGSGGTAATSNATSNDASSLAYSECGSGGGGCPASDPICLDESGVVDTITGAGGARTSLLFEACVRECETDSDCPAAAQSEARPRCLTDTGGIKVCALDCSDGAECPQGMQCSHNGQLCLYLHFAEWSGDCADPSSSISCVGDCLGQSDVTCTKSCSESEYTCMPNGH